LNTVLAMSHRGSLRHPEHGATLSVLQSVAPRQASLPKQRQSSAWTSHKQVRRLILSQWATVLACALGALGTYFAMKSARLNNNTGLVNWSWNWTFITNLKTSPAWTLYLNTGLEGNDIYDFCGSDDPELAFKPHYWSEGTVIQILLVAAMQSIVTLAMLTAELLVNLQRDEKFWRRATSAEGCRLAGYNSFLEVVKSPFALFLFGAKAFIHWYFGQAIIPTYDAIQCPKDVYWATGKPYIRFELAQLVYLTILLFAFASTFTWISCRRPVGPQPATYGHLQSLADLIDEWHSTLYWGHKVDGEICRAGTSNSPLRELKKESLYW
jgi:hypothetical protein